ncbi:MAG: NAD(P)-dependent alcohol dehydrogenase [Bacteroidota bacterium]
MKAVICTAYGGPEVLHMRHILKPEPKAREILIRTRATSVTHADFRIRSFTIPPPFGLPYRLVLGINKPRNPILGVELAGEVEAVGPEVNRFQPGDAVLAQSLKRFGGYAEYICMQESELIVPKPERISFQEAAAIPTGARTALHYLRKANIQPNQRMLIYGASGSVGSYAIQLARQMGAEVTAVCSRQNFDMVESLGADEAVDYQQHNWFMKIGKFDVVLVAVDKCPFVICNDLLVEDGTYMNISTPVPEPAMIWTRMTSAKKIFSGETPPQSEEDLQYLAQLVAEKKLIVHIDRSYPLDQIVAAHRYVDTGRKRGNVVIEV